MITINIQGSSAKFPLQVDPEGMTVEQVKKMIADVSEEKPAVDHLRLIYAGQILKNEKTLSEYKIQDNHTLHLVKRAAASGSPASTTTTAAPLNRPQLPQQQTQVPAPSGTMPPLSAFTGGMGAQHLLHRMQTAQPPTSGAMVNAEQLRLGMQMLRSNPELMRTMLQSGPLAGSGVNEEMVRMMLQPERIEEFLQSFTDPGKPPPLKIHIL